MARADVLRAFARMSIRPDDRGYHAWLLRQRARALWRMNMQGAPVAAWADIIASIDSELGRSDG